MVYYGSCERNLKVHTVTTSKASSLMTKKHATKLSKAIWNVKDAGETPLIEGSIVKRVGLPPYQCGSKTCQLCLAEKVIVLRVDKKNLLNERSELVSKCRLTKFLCKNV